MLIGVVRKRAQGRLDELGSIPIDEDEAPLSVEAALNFVLYCIARRQEHQPLMSVTPLGELDATWKDGGRYRVTLRFFADGRIWGAYRLAGDHGSFEAASLDDLLSPEFHFKIPGWA